MHSAKLVCTISIVLFFLAPVASADKHYIRSGFWGGIDAGAGFLKQSFDKRDDDDDTFFFLGFKG